jgi:ABC-2 type transport system ATP-binding protein
LGLRRPDSGAVEICGIDALAHPHAVKEKIGAALQSTALQDKITPREALRLFGTFYQRRAAADTLIERFSLQEKADAPFHTLSAGQRLRLALALAYVNEPDVLILDEPTVGLDPQSRRDLHASMRQLRAEKRTVVIATHDMDEAQHLCDRVAIIDHGRLIAAGTPEELVQRAALLSSITFQIQGALDHAPLQAIPGVQELKWHADRGSFRAAAPASALIELAKLLHAQRVELLSLELRRPTLEDAFFKLTGGR